MESDQNLHRLGLQRLALAVANHLTGRGADLQNPQRKIALSRQVNGPWTDGLLAHQRLSGVCRGTCRPFVGDLPAICLQSSAICPFEHRSEQAELRPDCWANRSRLKEPKCLVRPSILQSPG